MRCELIVIGTSFGGLKALTRILSGLPATMAAPIAVVQHRAADADGGLVKLLQQHAAVSVEEAEDKLPISGGHLYLAPAEYHLLVEKKGLLALSTEGPVKSARPSIDVLFESAADAYGPSLVGVVLTGASADGAAGVARIKAHGGIVLVEDPATAEARTMPDAAIAAAPVDYVLPLDKIAAVLVKLVAGIRT